MRQIGTKEAEAIALKAIGLNSSESGLLSEEAISCLLRRVAAFACPCTENTLIKAVLLGLEGLSSDLVLTRELIETCLETITCYGDLLYLTDTGEGDSALNRELLYASPPSFVRRKSGSIILLGVALDDAPILPPELGKNILHFKHMRILQDIGLTDLPERLVDLGLIELSLDTWLKLPIPEEAGRFIERINNELQRSTWSGSVPGLIILDTKRPVQYYRGRWAEPKNQTGRFIGRRKQVFGQNIWCYVEMQDGMPRKFLDLPLKTGNYRGRDEAWRIQAAIDFLNSTPQVFRKRVTRPDYCSLEFFSPLPVWAKRRIETFGLPIRVPGSLFSYEIADSELSEELPFLQEYLWMKSME